ncbi:hypothetical protein BN2476_1190028 [Paraburkholderia piptadeniae]|uniref:Uncharacterized protein n=1 Tax=Paraburkholderia piptadeniae TaxID=1701573 RepID=A0A1N7SVG3_9BURK|nr:hypothetical protein BN2476_1190028 [Paraburkholderia piptadeniae]
MASVPWRRQPFHGLARPLTFPFYPSRAKGSVIGSCARLVEIKKVSPIPHLRISGRAS